MTHATRTRIVASVAVLIVLVLCAPVQAQTPEIDALRARAEAGVAEAQNDLGTRYANGDGVPQDDAEAVRWYRLAADQGQAQAQYLIAEAQRLAREWDAAHLTGVSFSTPITAQQEPASPTTLKTVVEALGGSLSGTVNADGGPWGSANLTATEATDADLAHLTGLTTLTDLGLGGTPVTDAGLAHLTGLTGLETLDLRETQVTDAGIASLREALPNVVIRTGALDWAVPPPPPPPQ